MPLETSGFQLSQFERAPEVPGNIGVVDTKRIYGAVVDALKANEAIRTTQLAQSSGDAQLTLARDKAQAEMPLVGPEAAARLSQAQFLASPEYARTRQLLSGAKAQGVQEEETIKQQERARRGRLLTQASLQEDEARQAIQGVLEYADPKTRADELTKIRAQYPWLDTPEYATLSKSLDYHHKSAIDEAEREAAREHARELAEIRAKSTVEAVKARGGSPDMQLVNRLADVRQRLDEDPEDVVAKREYETVLGLINQKSATGPKSPTQALDAKRLEKANAAKNQIAMVTDKNAGVSADLDELEQLASQGTLGKWVNPVKAFLGETKTTRLNTLLETVKARELLDSLAQLKQQGGTLGQVTEKEGQQLSNAIANLNSALDETSFKAQLQKIRVARDNFLRRLQEAYEQDYTTDRKTPLPLPGGMTVPGLTSAGGESLDDRLRRY